MEKWQLWVLLESATVFALLTILFAWRIKVLRKKSKDLEQAKADDDHSEENQSLEPTQAGVSSILEVDYSASYNRFGEYLENQVTHAVTSVRAAISNQDEVATTKFKIWGTLVKAEKAIIDSDNDPNPRPILNRFLASILSALDFESRNARKSDLEKNLEDLDQEFAQASEVLLTKEELLNNQKALHEDLRKSIERAQKRVAQLAIKERELERLKSEQIKLREQINSINNHSSSHYDVPQSISSRSATPTSSRGQSRHLESLKQLSVRQQVVIEKLQEALDQQRTEQAVDQQGSQEVAIDRLEQMSNEALSLIDQLNTELDTTNLSIESLKQDISSKNQAILEIEQKLKETETTVITGLNTLQANKKEAFDSLKLGLSEAQTGGAEHNDFLINEHNKEVENLERLLQESETCVALLAQELQTAESEIDDLEIKIQKELEKQSDGSEEPDELQKLRDQNKQLATKTSELKAQIVEQTTNTDERSLRTEFNRKNLELDRLQLAYSDLERKYLSTLN